MSLPHNSKQKAVFFDLDGTFADTAPDLAAALNHLLRNHQQAPLPLDTIRPAVSHGGKALIELGFNITDTDAAFKPLRLELLDLYHEDVAKHTRPFPGIHDVLSYLAKCGYHWGIVTNKPGWLTEPLMAALELPTQPACIISGDTLPQRKPDPEPLLHACQLCGCQPGNSIYIGDAERDIVAGQRAGMKTLVALFGYIGEDEDPKNWGATALVRQPRDIIDWLHEYFV